MARRRMTQKVVSGLMTMSGLISAGSSAEVTGYAEDRLTAEDRKKWENVLAACAWINDACPRKLKPEEERAR